MMVQALCGYWSSKPKVASEWMLLFFSYCKSLIHWSIASPQWLVFLVDSRSKVTLNGFGCGLVLLHISGQVHRHCRHIALTWNLWEWLCWVWPLVWSLKFCLWTLATHTEKICQCFFASSVMAPATGNQWQNVFKLVSCFSMIDKFNDSLRCGFPERYGPPESTGKMTYWETIGGVQCRVAKHGTDIQILSVSMLSKLLYKVPDHVASLSHHPALANAQPPCIVHHCNHCLSFF